MTIEEKKEIYFKKWTYLNQLSYSSNDYDICREIKKSEDNFYKRYLFFKNYLLAKENLK